MQPTTKASAASSLIAWARKPGLSETVDYEAVNQLITELCTNPAERDELRRLCAGLNDPSVGTQLGAWLADFGVEEDENSALNAGTDHAYGVWGQAVSGAGFLAAAGAGATAAIAPWIALPVMAVAAGPGFYMSRSRMKLNKSKAHHAKLAAAARELKTSLRDGAIGAGKAES